MKIKIFVWMLVLGISWDMFSGGWRRAPNFAYNKNGILLANAYHYVYDPPIRTSVPSYHHYEPPRTSTYQPSISYHQMTDTNVSLGDCAKCCGDLCEGCCKSCERCGKACETDPILTSSVGCTVAGEGCILAALLTACCCWESTGALCSTLCITGTASTIGGGVCCGGRILKIRSSGTEEQRALLKSLVKSQEGMH